MVNCRSLSLRAEAIVFPRVGKGASSFNASMLGFAVAYFQRHSLFPTLVRPSNVPEPQDTKDSLSIIKEKSGGNQAECKDGDK